MVHCNLTDPTFTTLCRVIAEADELVELDLSWCERNSADFLDFYEVLAQNKKLTKLTLAWNSLFDQKKGIDSEMSEECQEGLDNLCLFIAENPKLLHLDLQNTDL